MLQQKTLSEQKLAEFSYDQKQALKSLEQGRLQLFQALNSELSILFSKLFYVVTGLYKFASALLPQKLHYYSNLRQLQCALVLSQNDRAKLEGQMRELAQKNEVQHRQIKQGYTRLAKMEREALGFKVSARQMEGDLQRLLRQNSLLEGQRREAHEQSSALRAQIVKEQEEATKLKKILGKVANYMEELEER